MRSPADSLPTAADDYTIHGPGDGRRLLAMLGFASGLTVVATAVLVRVLALWFAPSCDEAIFATVGNGWFSHGGLPYVAATAALLAAIVLAAALSQSPRYTRVLSSMQQESAQSRGCRLVADHIRNHTSRDERIHVAAIPELHQQPLASLAQERPRCIGVEPRRLLGARISEADLGAAMGGRDDRVLEERLRFLKVYDRR